jgi:HSP20 family protein
MSKKGAKAGKANDSGSGGFLGGIAEVLDKLSELAEAGRTLSRSGEFTSASGEPGSDKEFKGMYGFSVKVGLGGDEMKVEPFGNIKVDRNAREGVVVAEVREPAVDVLEEADHVLIVAEMPGGGRRRCEARGPRRRPDPDGRGRRQEVPQGGAAPQAMSPRPDDA